MTAAVAKTWRFVRKRKTEIVIFIIACLVAVLMIYPLMWMLSTSLKEQFYVYNTGIFYSNWKFGNYVEIFQETMLARAILNSLIVAIPPLVVSNLVCAVAAFAFAKIDFKGRDTVFMIMLSTMMIPFAVVMIPQFVLFKMLGLLSAGAAALIVPKLFGSIGAIFFMRQYMYGIPNSLIESAAIDGASYLRVAFSIIVPLCMPVIITQFILGFIGTWGDYMGPLIFIRDRDWWTVPLVIARYNSGIQGSDANLPKLMAASLVSMLPIFIVFAVFQKRIINSVMLSGMKL